MIIMKSRNGRLSSIQFFLGVRRVSFLSLGFKILGNELK
jgi:hypothetical protein